jgi:hypothetical protein
MQMKQCRVMQRHRAAPKTAPSVHPIKSNARASTYNQLHNQIKCSSIDPESTNDIPTESGTPDNWPSSTDAMKLPNQAETIFGGIDRGADVFGRVAVADVEAKSTSSDLDYLSVRNKIVIPSIVRSLIVLLRLPNTGTPCYSAKRWSQKVGILRNP